MGRSSGIIALVLILNSACDGGRVRKFGIIGGEETTISKFPYQVAYLYNDKLKCGASIISSTCLLTAGKN
jgi:hypothetical protein